MIWARKNLCARGFDNLVRFAAAIGLLYLTATAAERPNVLLIMSDDMGFSDLGCYGSKTPKLEGVSLRPAFTGNKIQREAPLCWEHESNRAIRQGKWKLVAKADSPWELYDMEADRTEMQNLAASQPEKVKELSGKWDAWAARAKVLPLGAWKGPGAK